MQSLNVLKRPPRVLSTRRPLARSTMRERSRLLWHTVVCLLSANHAWAQSQSQFQYIYDAAGSVTQITRSDVTPKPDLTISNVSVGAITANINGSYNIPVTFQVNNIGNATAAATWYDRGYLSASAVLHDADQVLGSYNTRGTNLNASANYTVATTFTTSTTTAAGNYYLILKADGGVSATGQYSPTGANYVAEANETNNTQAVAIALPASPKADLTVTNGAMGAVGVNQNGTYSIPVTFQVNNVGNGAAAAPWYDQGYLSADATLDNSDANLSGFHAQGSALAAGASYPVSTTFTTGTTTAPGNYTLFIKADGHGSLVGGSNTDNGNVAESSEANNTQALLITLPARPDLTVSNASVGAVTVNQNGTYNFPVTFTVTNIGGSTAVATWLDQGYLSADATLDNTDQNLTPYSGHYTSLAAGASYTLTTTFSTTSAATAPGNYTLFIKADGNGGAVGGSNTDNGRLAESNETNNTQALSITLPARPDLAVAIVSVGTIVKNGTGSYSIPVTYTVANIGGMPAQPNWYDLAYLSANATLDNADLNLSGYHAQPTALAAGASYTVTTTFTTATTTTAGNYTLFIKADGRGPAINVGANTDNGFVAEGDETNNAASVPISLP